MFAFYRYFLIWCSAKNWPPAFHKSWRQWLQNHLWFFIFEILFNRQQECSRLGRIVPNI